MSDQTEREQVITDMQRSAAHVRELHRITDRLQRLSERVQESDLTGDQAVDDESELHPLANVWQDAAAHLSEVVSGLPMPPPIIERRVPGNRP